MNRDRSHVWDVIGWFGGAVAATIVTSAIGVYTGSFNVVASFVADHLGEVALWVMAVFGMGVLLGMSIRHCIALRQLRNKDAEIAELKNMKREHNALFDEFRSLTHDEQRQIVSVMLSEPGGLAPTEDQRKHMGEWTTMKNFLRHDPGSDLMHLMDGVEDMLLENPVHVYGLMAARVSDLEDAVDDALDAMRAEIAGRDAEIAELESKIRHPVPLSMDALFAQPWQVRRAVLDAADKGWTDLPLGKAPNTVLSSMLSVEGIFRRRATLFAGMKSERETYYVTPEWKLLLMEDGNVEKLRVMVNG